ncbi:hypothetical protein C900_00201 [Fulvivirga imtechensis AK7]|uniref:Uncharacterized protein n=1 Tax=Fulvivirga imtechensis AK7 TaxID=1237149 RepID=L8JK36_9BACT|nr:hypothetical protein C900_00201 [Fulvivirga imtechensis AK7]
MKIQSKIFKGALYKANLGSATLIYRNHWVTLPKTILT